MKFFSIISSVVVFTAGAVSAWDLTLFMDDGRQVAASGIFGSGCVNKDFDLTSAPVNRAVFHETLFAHTFELYEGNDCQTPPSFHNGKGDFKLTPAKPTKSYKVLLS